MLEKDLLRKVKIKLQRPGESSTFVYDPFIKPFIIEAIKDTISASNDTEILNSLTKKLSVGYLNSDGELDLYSLTTGDTPVLVSFPFSLVIINGESAEWISDSTIFKYVEEEETEEILWYSNNGTILKSKQSLSGAEVKILAVKFPTLSEFPSRLESMLVEMLSRKVAGEVAQNAK